MRASRLLSILMLLQTRGRLSAPALAAELEVSTRTILRDIDQLSAAGVPVWADRGRDGGFVLQEGWSTQLTGLTGDEAQALSLAGLPKAATELGLGHAAASAHLKMVAALPVNLRADAERVASRLHIDPVEWYRSAAPPPHLQAVADAVWRQRVLHIQYESWNGVRHRALKPLGLVLKAGVWYLAALSDGNEQPRTYRLSGIQQLSPGKSFAYPKRFRLAAYWQEATQGFEAGIYKGQATVLATVQGIRRLKELSAAVAEAVARSATTDAGGWTRLTLPIESIEHAADQFLGLGAEVQVLAPAALRRLMQTRLRALSALYGG